MSIKKYTNNAWVSIPYKKYGTEADIITSFPDSIFADGTSATAVIKGNLYQNGRPSPTKPCANIYPTIDSNSINRSYWGEVDDWNRYLPDEPAYNKATWWGGLCNEVYLAVGTYTYSVYVKAEQTLSNSVSMYLMEQSEYPHYSDRATLSATSKAIATVTTSYQRISFTFNVTAAGYVAPRVEKTIDDGNNLIVTCYQLEAGSTATEYIAYGTTVSGAIYPQELGNKTANLFDRSLLQNGKTINSSGEIVDSSSRIATVMPIDISNYTSVILTYTSIGTSFIFATFNGNTLVQRLPAQNSGAVIDTTDCDKLYVSFYRSTAITTNDVTEIMLNTGSTALPYEPYGYKIPILCGDTTTPVYMGEVQSTRQIYKLVLTGQENWAVYSGFSAQNCYQFNTNITNHDTNSKAISTHFTYTAVLRTLIDNDGTFMFDSNKYIRVHISSCTTLEDFKAYLAQQYANGTPVCVWYVLATPTTTTLNEPLRKIGTYADSISNVTQIPTTAGSQTFDVQTDLKPSEVDLTYHGWHEHEPKEYSGGSWT